MIPGPNYVYECPNCGNLLIKESLMSGNTFGATIYSDGKRVAFMLPDSPDLTKCKKCDTIFWLSKQKEIGTYPYGRNKNPAWEKADHAAFLELEDYFNALSRGLAEDKEDERYVRREIWWAYNDKLRNGQEIFNNKSDELRWIENAEKLKTLLDPTDINQKLMMAELNRNLGDFEGCIEIIKNIDDDELSEIKEKFIAECKQENRWVIQLS